MSEAVAARIRRSIREHGPITFAEFMEHALYGPGGFYEKPPVGADRHFVTSPHVHPIFAELVLLALVELWEALDRPAPLTVVEVGAGDGTLARDLLRLASERHAPRLEYIGVEASAGARRALGPIVPRVEEAMSRVGALDRAVVFANELLDNLPFRRVRRTADGLLEVRVGAASSGFVEVLSPCEPELAGSVAGLRENEETTVSVEGFRFIGDLAATLRSGFALLVDYGSPGGLAGEVHGYRDHRAFDDVLRDPGSADITAGVDLGALALRAEERGLRRVGLVSQHDALLALGFGRWNDEQRERQGGLLAGGRGAVATRVWEGRGRANLLVDPAGLGRLNWLVLCTPGLRTPAFVAGREALGDRREE